MHCKINGGRLNFYEGKGEGKLISKIKCIHKAQKMIKDYIKDRGHYIKFLNKRELKILSNDIDLLKKVCEKDKNDIIYVLLAGDIDDIVDDNKPNRFIIGIFNTNNNLISISSIYKDYTEANIKGLYFAASCSVEQDAIRSPNSYIRAFSILELLKYNKFDIIGGIIGGDEDKLKKYHKDRGCIIEEEKYNNSYIYKCNIVVYLNTFFQNFL